MYTLISFSLAVIPALFLVRYFYRQDNLRPEPKGLVTKIFFFGLLSTIPIIILELSVAMFKGFFNFHPLAAYAFRAFFVAALCEESMKFFVVKKFAYNKVAFDEVMDGIVYTVVASLGFACMENIIYVMRGGISIVAARAFTAIPLHALASGIMGYYIGQAKFSASKKIERSLFLMGITFAIIIHGSYNFVLFATPEFGTFSAFLILPILVSSYLFIRKKIRAAKSEDEIMGRIY